MKPYLLEEIDEFGAAFGRIVWGETFDVEELHARHGACWISSQTRWCSMSIIWAATRPRR